MLRRGSAVLAILSVLAVPAWASPQVPLVLPLPASTPITSVDLLSYGGLSVVIVALVEVAKLLWKGWVAGKEPILSLGLTLVLGPVAKLMIPHAYENVPWVVFVVSLIVLQIPLNKVLHDSAVQPLTEKKS